MDRPMNHELVRAHVNARLDQTLSAQREQQLVRAWRVSRKAERAAARARLALARAL